MHSQFHKNLILNQDGKEHGYAVMDENGCAEMLHLINRLFVCCS